MDSDKRYPRDGRSLHEVESKEIDALRDSNDATLKPLAETIEDTVESPATIQSQGDIPGLDDNSRLDGAPSWDKARGISDEHSVGADPEPHDETPTAHQTVAAFRDGKPAGPAEAEVQVRPAGPDATRSDQQEWDEVDEAADESFPASDPPANY